MSYTYALSLFLFYVSSLPFPYILPQRPPFPTEAWTTDEVCRVQDHRARQLHLGPDGAQPSAVQTDVPGRGRAPVPRADEDHPPLGAPAHREGQVQAVRQGKWH